MDEEQSAVGELCGARRWSCRGHHRSGFAGQGRGGLPVEDRQRMPRLNSQD